jgi:hypothetical protein
VLFLKANKKSIEIEYKRTLDIKPKYTKAMNEIGWIYYNKGDKENAIAQWVKTLQAIKILVFSRS